MERRHEPEFVGVSEIPAASCHVTSCQRQRGGGACFQVAMEQRSVAQQVALDGGTRRKRRSSSWFLLCSPVSGAPC